MSAAAAASPAGPVQVQFQLGLIKEEVRVPAGNLSYGHAKRLAAEVIKRKVTLGGGTSGFRRSNPSPDYGNGEYIKNANVGKTGLRRLHVAMETRLGC